MSNFSFYHEAGKIKFNEATGLPSPVCVVCCATVMAVSVNNTSFTKIEI